MKNGTRNAQQQSEHSISTLNALLNDYSNNKASYLNLFDSNNGKTPSFHHQFLEGLYTKYSQSLEKYMKQNKEGMRLRGNRKYDNLPVDLFLKEGCAFKEAIISELHDKYNTKGSTVPLLREICLTPLPDKPRVLLTTQQEKAEFQTAERQAVVMRTVEYTNVLKSQTSQYASMKSEERLQMIYIMKKASSIIQNWWFNRGSQGAQRRRKRDARKNRGKAIGLFEKELNKIEDQFESNKHWALSVMKNKYNQSKYKIHSHELTLAYSAQPRFKRLFQHWDYFTKGTTMTLIMGNRNNSHCELRSLRRRSSNNDGNQLALIGFLQRKVKGFISKKLLRHIERIKLSKLLRNKIITSASCLIKAFLHWIHIINYYDNKSESMSSLPLWHTYLPNVLNSIANKRFGAVLLSLRFIQKKRKGIFDPPIVPLKKDNSKALEVLKPIIIARSKKNSLWKAHQLWNMLNVIVHMFVGKLTKELLQNSKRLFYAKITKGLSNNQRGRIVNQPKHYIISNKHTNNDNDNGKGNEMNERGTIVIRYDQEVQ